MRLRLVEDINFTDLSQDLEIIEYVLDMDREEIAYNLGMSISEFNRNLISPDRNFINDLYNFAYTNGILLNTIKWQEDKELYSSEEVKILCHGSRSGIKGNIRLDASSDSNDFGSGFYCGETMSQAGMFVSDEDNPIIYIIKFNAQGLNKIVFRVDTDWMLAVAYYRDTLGVYADSDRVRNIIDKVEQADYVIAPIADNKMFQIIDLFTSGEITDKQCQYALSATYLGYQYVFKKLNTLDNIEIIDTCYICPVEKSLYNKKAEVETNTSITKSVLAKKKYASIGRYIDQILS